MAKFKIGDVVQVKESGWGFVKDDVGKWVEIAGFSEYGWGTKGERGFSFKEYDEPLKTNSIEDSYPEEYIASFASLGENPMILLNTKDERWDNRELGCSEEHVKVMKGSKELVNKVLGINKHKHYFKDCPYDKVDVYRILDIWEVTDPCLQHLVKKGLCAGKRGHKDFRRDLQDIIDTAQRRIDMLDEDESVE